MTTKTKRKPKLKDCPFCGYAKRIQPKAETRDSVPKPVEEKPMTEKSNIDAAVERAQYVIDHPTATDSEKTVAKGILEMHEALEDYRQPPRPAPINKGTPRTDAARLNVQQRTSSNYLQEMVPASFARQLEIELAAKEQPKKVWTAEAVLKEGVRREWRKAPDEINSNIDSYSIVDLAAAIAADRNERQS
ncbi:MAG TPA: hypothetical protein VJZ94_00585 [Candidatus Paceibacterota bacterium]|nr:hypothetical protein [Candidatus Paceibacterota bacterium]